MFDGLFGDMVKTPEPQVGKVVEAEGEDGVTGFYFMLSKAEHFHGLFLAVALNGPEDSSVVGKPVVLVCHRPTHNAGVQKQAVRKCQDEQTTFVQRLRGYYVDKSRTPRPRDPGGAPRGRYLHHPDPWADAMPPSRAPKDCTCGVSCPARTSSSRTSPTEHADFLASFCEDHRPLVDAYLAEHTAAWPPKES